MFSFIYTKLRTSKRLRMFYLLFPVVVHLVAAAEQYRRADFPADFVFGSSTSAYQYEGAAFEEGRTPSSWDTFAHSGRTNGANGDVTCDGYHKYKDDIKRMHDMGLEAFRFSISWSRLIPNGRGPVNPMGLKYYNDFINELTFHGIQPHVTLHHFDLPQALEDEYGGWLSRNIVEDFTAYADVCFREFGDRVLHWTSVNEANVFAFAGYGEGFSPPGRCSDCFAGNSSIEPYIVAHNILLAHSAIAKLYKEKYKVKQKGYIGINILTLIGTPYTNTREDILATQRFNDYLNNWILNPLFVGDYPEIVKKIAAGKVPVFTENESKRLKGSLDFVGVNHYYVFLINDGSTARDKKKGGMLADIGVKMLFVAEGEGMVYPEQFPIKPSGLYGVLEYIKQTYGNPPVYIHENGQTMKRNGTLIDTARVDFISAYIGATLDAIRNGSNTKGYFVWTFLDCFEVLGGYEPSYGFYYVDLDDKELKRYPKLSAFWYSDFLNEKNTRKHAITQVGENISISLT